MNTFVYLADLSDHFNVEYLNVGNLSCCDIFCGLTDSNFALELVDAAVFRPCLRGGIYSGLEGHKLCGTGNL